MKIISEVVLSVKANNMKAMDCEQLPVEVGKLEESKQQGTFEWVDSVLVGSMTRGS